MPAFRLWSSLIPQDAEMSNCGRACEELISPRRLGTAHQTVLHSQFWTVQNYSPPGVYAHTHTHTHTHILQGTNDTRDWCNRWKWVIWIRLDYGVEEVRRKKKRARERRWKRVGSKSSSLRGKNNYISLTPGASECTSVCRRHDSKTSVRM